jgi:[acyl-carrier-protein] S-malonyltransferase
MSKIAFLFPGQGQQYPGMGKELCDNFESASRIFDRASEALGMDMKELVFNGSEEDLKKTENTQPSILTASMAIFEVLRENGIAPEGVAGLSLGEYSAVVSAGGMDFEDAVRLVQKRGRFMQDAVPEGVGGMAAILGLANDLVEKSCEEASSIGYVSPANYNCPGQLVIAGELKAVEKAAELCKGYGAKKAVMLPVSAPFHTKLLEGAGDKLKGEIDKIVISNLNIPVYANVDASPTTDGGKVADNLVRQVSSSVMFQMSIEKMINDGFDTFLEVGPDKALSKFVKKISKDVKLINVEDMESLNKALELLKA